MPLIFSSLVARTNVAPMSITDSVRKAIWAVDKDQPVWSIYSLESAVDRTQGQSRFLALLLGIFAAVALLLAGVGIYGVTSYGVAQRTHEIGIRLALGASGERVLREIVGRGVRLTLVAVAIGLTAAVLMGRLASAVLFGVEPTDPGALAGAAAVLALGLARGDVPAGAPRRSRGSGGRARGGVARRGSGFGSRFWVRLRFESRSRFGSVRHPDLELEPRTRIAANPAPAP